MAENDQRIILAQSRKLKLATLNGRKEPEDNPGTREVTETITTPNNPYTREIIVTQHDNARK